MLKVIAGDGLQVNNLFQTEDNLWRANVRRLPAFHEFGTGKTPQEALLAAISCYRTVLGSHKLPAIKPAPRLVIVKRKAQ